MKLKSISIALSAVLVLTACQDVNDQNARKQRYGSDSFSYSLKLTDAGAKLPLLGATTTEIMTRTGGTGSWKLRLYRGTCKLESTAFTMTVETNTEFSVPSFGRQTPPMTVTCDMKDGHPLKPQVVQPINLTRLGYQELATAHILVGFGLLGAAVTASLSNDRDKSADVFGYPQQVKFRYPHSTF